MKAMTHLSAAVLLCATLAGPVSAAQAGSDAAAPPPSDSAALPPSDSAAPPSAPRDDRYRIEPSDVLAVKYRYTPEYDYTSTVQPDGYISLPVTGQVKVGGLTVAAAIEAIQQQAATRLRDPEVTMEVKEFQRPRFFVGGEVGKPGEFQLRGQLGLLEAVAMAGGFKASAKHSQVVLFRKVDAVHAMRTVLDAKDLAKNIEAQNVTLKAGDLLFVPQNRISKVLSVVPLAAFAGALGSMALFFNYIE